MVGAALLILQRRCRGRCGRRPPANEVRCDGGAIGPAAVSCALQGVKKKSSPRRDCCLAVFWCGGRNIMGRMLTLLGW